MRVELIEQLGLICPLCRRPEIQSPLALDQVIEQNKDFVLEGFLICSHAKCQTKYPIIEGVPVVLKNMKRWWNSASAKLSNLFSDKSPMAEYFNTLNKSEQNHFAETSLLSTYMDSHYGAEAGLTHDDANSFGKQLQN